MISKLVSPLRSHFWDVTQRSPQHCVTSQKTAVKETMNWYAEENVVVNNKDNRVLMSWNYQSDSCPFET